MSKGKPQVVNKRLVSKTARPPEPEEVAKKVDEGTQAILKDLEEAKAAYRRFEEMKDTDPAGALEHWKAARSKLAEVYENTNQIMPHAKERLKMLRAMKRARHG